MCAHHVNLADDVLLAVKERARRDRRSVGDVVSDLVREALTARAPALTGEGFHGFRPLPRRGRAVSNALVDQLREDEWEVSRALLDSNVLLACSTVITSTMSGSRSTVR